MFWLLIAIVLVIEIPLLIYSVTYSLSHALTTGRDITAEPIYWLLAIPTMIVVAAVTLRFAFAYPLVAEGYGVLDAMRVSNQMVTGRGWYTFLVMLLLYLIYVAGALALIVGILFTIPVAFTIYGCYYNAVKAEAGVG
ncbi:MAG: hypothetical protein BWY76_03030 [bacterium ADurb.Bin429]|nr:MAG: hypothetical protein BWY76_03030 [bacterium ADurb.Bin429]